MSEPYDHIRLLVTEVVEELGAVLMHLGTASECDSSLRLPTDTAMAGEALDNALKAALCAALKAGVIASAVLDASKKDGEQEEGV